MNETEEKRKEQLLAKMLKSDFEEEKDFKITFYYAGWGGERNDFSDNYDSNGIPGLDGRGKYGN